MPFQDSGSLESDELCADQFHLAAYVSALINTRLMSWYLNSIGTAVIITVVVILCGMMCAYALSQLRFPGRRVVFVHPDDLAALEIPDGTLVDIVSEWTDSVERRASRFRVVAYPTARGCAAAYFPEANVLVPLDSTAAESNTPTSKQIIVRLEPAAAEAG
jgi:hypothetical protein